MSMQQMQSILPVFALAPDADRWASDPSTDVVNMADYQHCDWIVMEGVGGVGTTTFTVEECDDTVPTNPNAIGFRYRVAQTGDTFGDWITVAATGYLSIAGANKMIQIQIDADQLADGFPYVQLTTAEGDSTAVDAGIVAILSGPRYAEESPPTALT